MLAAFLERQARLRLCASFVPEMKLEAISVRPASRRDTIHIMELSGNVLFHMLYVTNTTAHRSKTVK